MDYYDSLNYMKHDTFENDFSFEETTGYGHQRRGYDTFAVPDPLHREIDEETGCTGAEMHALDCTVDEILWYESARYRERTLRRLRPDRSRRLNAPAHEPTANRKPECTELRNRREEVA